MTLPLTPEVLEHAYEFLRVTEPFCRWNLPHGEDVTFQVVRDPKLSGWHKKKNGKHYLAVSRRTIGYTISLMDLMSHEMIHVHQAESGMETKGAEHNAAFRKDAALVCRYHGFDPKTFC